MPADTFQFFSSVNLSLVTNRRARDLAELVAHLREVPGAVIYYHTHHFLVQHQYLSPEPPNDFAYWVTTVLQEDRLGEQLAAIDMIQFRSLRVLRERIVEMIDAYIEQRGELRPAPPGEELHLREAATFVVPTGLSASTLSEFADCMERVGFGALAFHFFDARLRLERGENDFSEWLRTRNEPALANAIARLDPYTHTMDGLRREVVRLTRRRLAEGDA